jgi:hypothetical protein
MQTNPQGHAISTYDILFVINAGIETIKRNNKN